MPKNILICCDGTGNEIADNHSNVLKLYRVLQKSAQQLVYYDPGVGTVGARNEWERIKQQTEQVAGLALGYGLDKNVLDAYRFLVSNYKTNDRIFMFGFSRGAYTVRVLAGFLNTIGLMSPQQIHLSDYALVAYKQITEGEGFASVRLFEQVLRPKRPPIRFLGLWDTVSSVIVPRRDRFYVPSLRQLAYTARNPSVESVRHALAIDERRRMFRPYLWTESEPYWGGPFEPKEPTAQDVKQVWFAGVHSDVGGGYPEAESGLSKLALKWMIDESPDELKFVTQSVNQVVLGKKRKDSRHVYSPPDPEAKIHQSLKGAWNVLEWLPKRDKRREWPQRESKLGWYLPRAEPRFIETGSVIHPSVTDRKESEVDYDPVNLPAQVNQSGS
jgi:uncharacterized protein (DUF2235 family)